jgi:hypothetical protein
MVHDSRFLSLSMTLLKKSKETTLGEFILICRKRIHLVAQNQPSTIREYQPSHLDHKIYVVSHQTFQESLTIILGYSNSPKLKYLKEI